MNQSRLFLLSLMLGTVSSVSAMGASKPQGCEEKSVVVGNLRAYAMNFLDGRCSISISPDDTGGTLIYRSYSFYEDGLFMVFSSVDGPEATSAGSRSFFLFPRGSAMSMKEIGDGTFEVRASSGTRVVLNASNARLNPKTDFEFTEDPQVSMGNAGGVEITRFGGLLLDTGWQLGNVAYAKPKRTSVFRDSSGRTCTVINQELFSYSGDPRFKFDEDSALKAFLEKRCPQLDLSLLGK